MIKSKKINKFEVISMQKCLQASEGEVKTLRVYLVGVKTERMGNGERKIRWKMLFFTVWLRKENRKDRKYGRKFPLLSPFFLFSQIGREMRRKKWWEMHFTQIPPFYYTHRPLSLFHYYIIRTVRTRFDLYPKREWIQAHVAQTMNL